MRVPAAQGDLLDIIVWVALANPDHIHHAAAQTYWHRTARDNLWFCRHTMIGMMRLLCQPAFMNQRVLTPTQAFEAYQHTRAQTRVGMLVDVADLETVWLDLAKKVQWPPRMWPDAYLAAFAIAGNLRLTSFDGDFSRFPGLDWLHLTAEVSA